MAKQTAGKKEKGPNKSQAVRDYSARHPNSSAAEVKAALAKQGLTITEALVYNVRSYDKMRSGTGSTSAKRFTSRPAENGAAKAESAKSTESMAQEKSEKKSDAIRAVLADKGRKVRPRDVIAILGARGIVVSAAQVSNVGKKFFRMRRRAMKAEAASAAGAPVAAKVGADEGLTALFAAKELADKLGGIDAARHALDTLAKLR